MRRTIGAALAAVLVGLLPLTGTASAGMARMNVCHILGTGNYDLIEVAEPGYYTHLNHGDALVGDPVPGMGPAWVFDASCKPFERPPVVLARVWSVDAAGVTHEMIRLEDTNWDGTPSVGDVFIHGEYPYFVMPARTLSYGRFTATTHVAEWVYIAKQDDGTSMLKLMSGGGSFDIYDFTPTATNPWDEAYAEQPNDPLLASWWKDFSLYPYVDTTQVFTESPGHPDGAHWGYGSNPGDLDLLRIEFNFSF